MGLLANLVDGLDSLVVELTLLEVLTDARGSNRLGNDGVAADLSPCQQNVCGGNGLALGGGQALSGSLDIRVGDEQRCADGVVAEGGVRCNDDVLLGAVLHQLSGLQTRVALDLVGGGDNAGGVDDGLELWKR